MPFRSIDTLNQWLEDFGRLGFPAADSLRVIEQDGAGGADTGLIALGLRHTPTTAYIQPIVQDSVRWVVTFEMRDDQFEMDAAGVAALSAELAVVAALAAFLQAKSDAFSET